MPVAATDRSENVATPPLTVRVVVPASVPEDSDRLTLSLLSLVSRLPYVSRTRTVTMESVEPAEVDVGCCEKTSWFAAAGVTTTLSDPESEPLVATTESPGVEDERNVCVPLSAAERIA